MRNDYRYITNLTDVKSYLNITDTSQDTALIRALKASEQFVINYTHNEFKDSIDDLQRVVNATFYTGQSRATTLTAVGDIQTDSTLDPGTIITLDAVLDIQTDALLDPGATPTTGDRYIITDKDNLHANFGVISGIGNNDIVEYTGAAFEVDFDASEASDGDALNDEDSTDNYEYTAAGGWTVVPTGDYPTTGDRYILTDTSALNVHFANISGVGDNDIVEFDGTNFVVSYDASAASDGDIVNDEDSGNNYRYTASGGWELPNDMVTFSGLNFNITDRDYVSGDVLKIEGTYLNDGYVEIDEVTADSITIDSTSLFRDETCTNWMDFYKIVYPYELKEVVFELIKGDIDNQTNVQNVDMSQNAYKQSANGVTIEYGSTSGSSSDVGYATKTVNKLQPYRLIQFF